jgi:hypothetical protein
MPIRPENRARYPKDWKAIVAAIRERSGNCCEGSPAYPDCRAANGQPHPVTGSKVILTTAHLDHTPENCDDENLRHWCQRCHNTYDAAHRSANRSRRIDPATQVIKTIIRLDLTDPQCADVIDYLCDRMAADIQPPKKPDTAPQPATGDAA